MNHEEALTHLLAGEPCPIGARDHLRTCPDCSRELADLRALERRLVSAAPLGSGRHPRAALPPPGKVRRGNGPLGWAAAAAMVAAFLGVLLTPGGEVAPPASAGRVAVQAEAWSEGNGGTLALLDALESRLGGDVAGVPEGVDAYLDSPYYGGGAP